MAKKAQKANIKNRRIGSLDTVIPDTIDPNLLPSKSTKRETNEIY
jgi:hypothetical protein